MNMSDLELIAALPDPDLMPQLYEELQAEKISLKGTRSIIMLRPGEKHLTTMTHFTGFGSGGGWSKERSRRAHVAVLSVKKSDGFSWAEQVEITLEPGGWMYMAHGDDINGGRVFQREFIYCNPVTE